jgi:hypothetical protein
MNAAVSTSALSDRVLEEAVRQSGDPALRELVGNYDQLVRRTWAGEGRIISEAEYEGFLAEATERYGAATVSRFTSAVLARAMAAADDILYNARF